LDIEYLLNRKPQGLSGGESQRVALGRALSFQPRILLLDEPLSALDDSTRQKMYDLLKKVSQHTKVTVLHITHSRSEAQKLADVHLELQAGKVAEVERT
jgi:ABC-type molybdate transport system ATPase subunit